MEQLVHTFRYFRLINLAWQFGAVVAVRCGYLLRNSMLATTTVGEEFDWSG